MYSITMYQRRQKNMFIGLGEQPVLVTQALQLRSLQSETITISDEFKKNMNLKSSERKCLPSDEFLFKEIWQRNTKHHIMGIESTKRPLEIIT